MAVLRTKRILWEPFQGSKWLRLGFCAFLMGSAPAGFISGGSPQSLPGDGTNSALEDIEPEPLLAWLQQHSLLVTLLVVSALVVSFLVAVLLTWLSSRGQFMMLDAVIHNRATTLAAWRDYRREANSLFRFRFLLGLLTLLVLGLLIGVPLSIGLADWNAAELSLRLIVVSLIAVVLLLLWLVAMGLISVLLLDFVAPVMAVRRIPVAAAWNVVIHDVLRPHPGAVLLYLVARGLLSMAIALMAFAVILLTCCLAALPYLGSVLLLPFTVFLMAYPLAFLEQLGPEWRFFAPERSALPPA
ncbi:MAG: hypothetical protein ACKO0M_08530 [Cyanobium sp.]